jgi:hypothetical protein
LAYSRDFIPKGQHPLLVLLGSYLPSLTMWSLRHNPKVFRLARRCIEVFYRITREEGVLAIINQQDRPGPDSADDLDWGHCIKVDA